MYIQPAGGEVGHMRTLAVRILALLSFAVPAAAQEPDAKAVRVPWANKMFVGETDSAPPTIVHDFGVLKKGAVRAYRFEVTNIYAVPLEIERPKSGSRCLSVKDFTGKLRSGESGHILVEIDTAQFDGPKAIRLPVTFRGTDPKTEKPYISTAELEVWAISR